jgi:hypothetical protein
MPDDHSESVPPLPIPNRTVKRLHADDSADTRVKVGNRQAPHASPKPPPVLPSRGFVLSRAEIVISEDDARWGVSTMLDNVLCHRHNRPFSAEGCPSG